MKIHTVRQVVLAAGMLVLASCDGSSGGGGGVGEASDIELHATQKAILVQFTDAVIVPTYKDLAAKSAAMKAAGDAFAAAPTQETLQAAEDAWIATRIPWEQSEAFLFGPVETNSYDPQMDQWPLIYTDLASTIAASAQSSVDIEAVAPELKGFHTIEYIYWGQGKSKTLANFTPAEFAYLKLLLQDHARITAALSDAWSKATASYASLLKTAGDAGNEIYPSTQDGIQEMLEAMVGIADEVGASKISGPTEEQNPDKVESQFSYNSQVDFENNILSIRNAYQGSLDGTVAAASLSTLVASKNAELDAKIKAGIAASVAAIDAIPHPFRDAVTNPAAKPSIDAAVATIKGLYDLLNDDLRTVLFHD